MTGDGLTILVAEDDDGHAVLIEEGLRDSGVSNPILRFRDGVEALAFLEDLRRGVGPGHRVLDYLLLLDINMPRIDGVETLSRVKSDPILRDIPVIMLTTADDPAEIERCYRLGCNMYVAKPIDFEVFAKTLTKLGLFLQIIRT